VRYAVFETEAALTLLIAASLQAGPEVALRARFSGSGIQAPSSRMSG
jgi:hypothetical protein